MKKASNTLAKYAQVPEKWVVDNIVQPLADSIQGVVRGQIDPQDPQPLIDSDIEKVNTPNITRQQDIDFKEMKPEAITQSKVQRMETPGPRQVPTVPKRVAFKSEEVSLSPGAETSINLGIDRVVVRNNGDNLNEVVDDLFGGKWLETDDNRNEAFDTLNAIANHWIGYGSVKKEDTKQKKTARALSILKAYKQDPKLFKFIELLTGDYKNDVIFTAGIEFDSVHSSGSAHRGKDGNSAVDIRSNKRINLNNQIVKFLQNGVKNGNIKRSKFIYTFVNGEYTGYRILDERFKKKTGPHWQFDNKGNK